MKRVRQRGGKRLGEVGIALEQDYISVLHGEDSSYMLPLTTAGCAPRASAEQEGLTATLVASLTVQTARPEFFRFA